MTGTIYTRSGDDGTTRAHGGPRIGKNHPRVEACGAVDELNASLGVVRSVNTDPVIEDALSHVQPLLLELGAELASWQAGQTRLAGEDVAWAEQQIDAATAACPTLAAFVVPGGVAAACHLHVARTVCRRAERRIASLAEEAQVSATAMQFVNRLSDLLFARARLANARAGVPDVEWTPRAQEQADAV